MRLRHSPFIALKFRDFRLLWIGMLVSRIGSEMQVVAIAWHLYTMTNSPLSLGLIGLSRIIPIAIFSLIAGLVADIYDRKKIMLISQIIMMTSTIYLAYVTLNNQVTPFFIYAVLAINSFAQAFDTPARQSIIPSLIPKEYFMNAVSINTTMWQSAVVIGPAVAGFAIDFFGLASVYFINAISFFGVIIALLLMSPLKHMYKEKAAIDFKSIKEGIHFVKNNPLIYSTMILDFFATFFASATTLLPIFAKDILAVGPRGLGFLYAAPSIGGVLAGMFLSGIGHFKNQGKILLTAVGVYGLSTIIFGLSNNYLLSLTVLAFVGSADIISSVIRNTIRQLNTPDYIRGRMSSINLLFLFGGPQLGEVEAGILATAFGTPISVVIGGIGTIAVTLLVARLVPRIRNFQGHEILA